jgi:hypothetical protein
MKIKQVAYTHDYIFHIVFEDGVEGDVNLEQTVEVGIFRILKDKNMFAKAYTKGRSIAWSDELEIDADTIYLELTGKRIEEVMPVKKSYASN